MGATMQEAAQTDLRSDVPEVLERIHAPGCAAAIWKRQGTAATQGWLDRLPPEHLPALRTESPVHAFRDAVEAACTRVELPGGADRAWLCADIQTLATRFAEVMGARRLALRLDVVCDDACRKFHLDNVPARLLCTYRGAGTEYGTARHGGAPEQIERMKSRWVAVFRGAAWPGDALSGLVHRSPPIAGRGETRLLLVIDAVEHG